MINHELLAVLVCPDDRTPLDLADDALLSAVNRAIVAGRLKNRGGDAPAEPFKAALVRRDRAVLYPIIDRIPILLLDSGIELAQIETGDDAG